MVLKILKLEKWLCHMEGTKKILCFYVGSKILFCFY